MITLSDNNTANLKPTLTKVSQAFDADKDYTVSFIWRGDSISKSQIFVYNNETDASVYTGTNEGESFKATIPAGKLSNGMVCYIRVQITDIHNVQSALSDKNIVYCLKTPQLSFGSVKDNSIIQNSVLETSILYSQPQGEELNEYQVFLYDSEKKEIDRSDVCSGLKASIRIDGLSNMTKYYIRALGSTTNKMTADTGYVSFQVEYPAYLSNTALKVENKYHEGGIMITSNIKTYGWEQKNPIPGESSVDLKNGFLDYNDGAPIDGKFLYRCSVFDPIPNSELLRLTGEADSTISLYYYLTGRIMENPPAAEQNVQAYLYLEVRQGILKYVQATPRFPIPAPTDRLDITIRRDHTGYYSLQADVVSPVQP